MTSNKVNIFDFATSELSHDAILCYILSSYDSDNEVEKRVSRRMFAAMLGKEDLDSLSKENIVVENESPKKQYPLKGSHKGFIDIFVEVKIGEEDYILAIEDKIHTNHHGNQLSKYQESVNEEYKGGYTVKYIFLTLGLKSLKYLTELNNGGNYDQKWTIIDRDCIYSIINIFEDNSSSILNQYREYLKSLVNNSDKFVELPILEWSNEMSQRFFMTLDNKRATEEGIDGYGWGYVNNRKGGFQGYWYNIIEMEKKLKLKTFKYSISQQLEFSGYMKRIALKLGFDVENFEEFENEDKNFRINIANELVSALKIEKKSKEKNSSGDMSCFYTKTNIKRGKHMTIGEYVITEDSKMNRDDLIKCMIEINRSLQQRIESMLSNYSLIELE